MRLKEKILRKDVRMLFGLSRPPPVTKGASASGDRLSGKMGRGSLPPAVPEHSPQNKVGQDLLVSVSAPAALQQC